MNHWKKLAFTLLATFYSVGSIAYAQSKKCPIIESIELQYEAGRFSNETITDAFFDEDISGHGKGPFELRLYPSFVDIPDVLDPVVKGAGVFVVSDEGKADFIFGFKKMYKLPVAPLLGEVSQNTGEKVYTVTSGFRNLPTDDDRVLLSYTVDREKDNRIVGIRLSAPVLRNGNVQTLDVCLTAGNYRAFKPEGAVRD